MSSVLESTSELVAFLEHLFESYQRQKLTRDRGRPKLSITKERLLQSHFSIHDVAALFGCSTRITHRRVAEFGHAGVSHCVLSDSDFVRNFVQVHPANEQRILVGHLCSLGLHILRQRVHYG